MRRLALVLLCVGVLSGCGFLADYLWTTRAVQRTPTSKAIAVSAAGIVVLVAVYTLDAAADRGRNSLADWLEISATGLLASAMYPVWWLRMRALRRSSR